MEAAEAEYEELPPGTSMAVNLTAGALAGIFEHTVTFPLDSIKTRLQSVHNDSASSAQTAGRLGRDSIRSILGREGLGRLWRGVWSVVIGAGPAHAVYFASYERCKQALGADVSLDVLRFGAAGMVATTLSDAVMTPFDVVKQRLQLNQHSSVWKCLRALIRQEGWRSLYISYPTTLLLNIPFHGLHFPVYELVQRSLNPENRYAPAVHCVAGGIAGGTAAALTTPIDSIKTLLQTRGMLPAPMALRVSGIASAAAFIARERGLRGFWAGVSPRVLSHVPATAACWTIYEYFKMFLSSSD
jgi:solute carrier family 25 iron transporter 28/37